MSPPAPAEVSAMVEYRVGGRGRCVLPLFAALFLIVSDPPTASCFVITCSRSTTRATVVAAMPEATGTGTTRVFGGRDAQSRTNILASSFRRRWLQGGVVGSRTASAGVLRSTAVTSGADGEDDDEEEGSSMPPPLAEEGDWAAYVDREGTGQIYYFNGLTGESSWDPPTDTFPPVSVPSGGGGAVEVGSGGTTTTTTTPLYSAVLDALDGLLVRRAVALADHVPAMASLLYFGLIAMITGGGPSTSFSSAAATSSPKAGKGAAAASAAAAPAMVATLRAALTRPVGPTTNRAFSSYFPTLVTPANFVFLIWPVIAALQFLTVSISAVAAFFGPGDDDASVEKSSGGAAKDGPVLSQSDLSSLAVANLFATGWLIASSRALADSTVPILSSILLPFVPIFAGYPLRRRARSNAGGGGSDGDGGGLKLLVYRVYTSFTVLASILALAVEIQHGGRVPSRVGGGRPVPAALTFLGCATFVVNLGGLGLVQRAVNVLALGGIAWRGTRDAIASGVFSSDAWLGGAWKNLGGKMDHGTLAVLALTVACTLNAVWRLFSPGGRDRGDAERGS